MCVVIYLALALLALLYSDSVIEPLALSTQSEGQLGVVMALGWEIVPVLWPLLLLAMVLSSALTLFVSSLLRKKEYGDQ